MQGKWPLGVAVLSALVGVIFLAAWFTTYWPATRWPVLSRAQLVAKARQISNHFGLDTGNWKEFDTAKVLNALSRDTGPNGSSANRVPQLSVQITLAPKEGDQKAEVDLDSAGLPIRWHAPEGIKAKQHFSSDEEAAKEAFQYFAGTHAGEYGAVARSAGEESHERNFVWKKIPALPSGQRERIAVVTKDSGVQSAQRKVDRSSNDDDLDGGDQPGYWSAFSGVFGMLCTGGAVAILSIYVLWLVRKAINHQFPIRMMSAALLVLAAAFVAGAPLQQLRAEGDGNSVVASLFMAGIILCCVAVGRGISAEARPKWMSLEQLCALVPIAKATGESLAAGVLFSPLLVSIPFLIVGCRWFSHSLVVANNAKLLYSRAPLLDSLDIEACVYQLAFFGFALPALRRLIRFRWLAWFVTVPIGTFYFADYIRVVSGSVAAPLMAGFCTFLLFLFVYVFFDLLAVLTLQLASGLLLSTLILAQKSEEIWGLVTALVGVLAFAGWCSMRGQASAEGDPRASNPALADFRAEREKLKAEFSLARRAQQEMLPQTPPSIPGYSIAASCTPSLEVGGDLYDFLKLPDGRIGIGVADVSGKGVPAALYMTLTKGLLVSITKHNSELASVVEEVNRHLHSVTRKKVFVTMALGFLDRDKGELECIRAGHNPVVWRQAVLDKTTLISPGGLGLGITAGRIFSAQLKVATMALTAGDAVVFYSDGITEAMNSELEQFGEQRLIEAVQKTDSLDAVEARDSILRDVRDFLGGVHPQDDMTLVVLRAGAQAVSAVDK